jgi:hypothetical protein
MVAEVAEAVTDGVVVTVNDKVLVFVQPKVEVPTSVYMVVAVGVTATVAPVKAPGFHV